MTRIVPVVVSEADDEAALVRIPIVGRRLTAGFPSPADDFVEEALELPRWLAPNPPATFLWRVTGWSVVGAGIHDGDLAVVDRSLRPVSGDIVVAVIDDEPSLKRYRVEGSRPVLAFDNPEMPAFPFDEMTEASVWGVVTVSLRLHRPLVRSA